MHTLIPEEMQRKFRFLDNNESLWVQVRFLLEKKTQITLGIVIRVIHLGLMPLVKEKKTSQQIG